MTSATQEALYPLFSLEEMKDIADAALERGMDLIELIRKAVLEDLVR